MAVEKPTWIYKSEGDLQTASEMNQLAQAVITNATELSNTKDDIASLSDDITNFDNRITSIEESETVKKEERNQPNGYAGLDSSGKLPIEKTYGTTATVVDVATYELLPVTGLSGVIYYVSSTSAQYKWSGSAYIDITDGADNAKKNETSIFDCSNGTSTKYYSSLSAAINVVPPVHRTSNRIISYLSTGSSPTSAVNYQFHGIDSTTWTDLTKWERIPNQADLAEIRSDLNEIEQEQIQGGVYDVSSHNNGAVFESLSALLGSANLSTLIPASVRRGGMSIRFIQDSVPNSDNKYVQYRLVADEWSINTEDWTIADEGVYIENPEFAYVKTDNKDRIIYGVKTNGKFFFGEGCPQQIKDYIEDKISSLSLDEYEDVVAFLIDYIGGDTTLKEIIGDWPPSIKNKKISILGDSISTFNQDGYMIPGYAMYYPTLPSYRGADVTSVSDTWWMQVINSIDSILEINASYSGSTASNRSIGFSPRVPLLGNPDIVFIALGTNDSNNSVPIGTIDFNTQSYDLTQFAPAYIKGIKDTIAAYPKAKIICVAFDMGVAYQNAIKIIAEHYGAEYIYVGDVTDVHPNKSEMTAAADSIIKYTKFTITDEIKNLSNGKVDKEEGKSLIDADYADSKNAINNPEFAEVTIDSEDRVVSHRDKEGILHENVGIETKKLNLSTEGLTEFQQHLLDNDFIATKNNYSSDNYVHISKPKFAFINIICDKLPTAKPTEYEGFLEYYDTFGNYFKKPITALGVQGRSSTMFIKKNYSFDINDDSKIKFGNWVEQDSYHLKANYIDSFRGARSMIGYNMTRQIMDTYSFEKARPWRYLYYDDVTLFNSTGKISDDLSDEASAVPDGFPIKLFHNGTYIGLYTLQIKKHRDNYNMGKSKPQNIHIDGEDYANSLFNGENNIIWSKFEIRNPKGLIDINGNEYDGDSPTELSDTDELSNTVKEYIKNFSLKASNIITTTDFEDIINVDYSIDYFLLMSFVMNIDVFTNNTQWCTWDGGIWFPLNYDNDQCFGLYWEGYKIRNASGQLPSDCILGLTIQSGTPFTKLLNLYKNRIDLRYKELVDKNILTVENVMQQLKDWCNNIGKKEYDKEFEKWNETPSYRDGSTTYTNYPLNGGFYDSINRVEKYMIARKQFMDSYFNYI